MNRACFGKVTLAMSISLAMAMVYPVNAIELGKKGGGGGGYARYGTASAGGFSSTPRVSNNMSVTQNKQKNLNYKGGNTNTQVNNRQTNIQHKGGNTNTQVNNRQTNIQYQGGTTNNVYYGGGGRYYGPPPGSYHYDDDHWDNGEVAALAVGTAALGAVVGYAAGSNNASNNTTYVAPAPIATLPCTPIVTSVRGVTYYQCGSSWYTLAYASTGPMYMPSPSPY